MKGASGIVRLLCVHFAVEERGLALAGGLGYIEHLDREHALAEVQSDHVADLDVVRRAGDLAVDGHAAAVAGLVCHGAALDEARDLEIFVKTHGIRLLFGKVRDQRGATNSNGGASRRRFDDERA